MPIFYKKITAVEFFDFVILAKKIIRELDQTIYSKAVLNNLLTGFNYENLEGIFKNPNSSFWLIQENQVNRGFAFGWKEHGVFWLNWIGILENSRSKGLGAHFFQFLEEEAIKMNCHKISFNMLTKNQKALQFYLKLGYTIEGTLTNHWFNESWTYLGKTCTQNN